MRIGPEGPTTEAKVEDESPSNNAVLKNLEMIKARVTLEKAIAAAQNEIADSQQKIAEANKAALAAQFPVGTAKPLEGTITTDDKFGYGAEVTAHKALLKKAEHIAKQIKELNLTNPRILIVDTLDFSIGDVELIQITSQLNLYLKALPEETEKTQLFLKAPILDLEELKREINLEPTMQSSGIRLMLANVAAGAGLAGLAGAGLAGMLPFIPGVVSAAADVAGYFQVNYDVKGRSVTPQDSILQAALAGQLAKSNISVFFPNLHRISKSPLVEKLMDCLEKRVKLAEENAALKSSKIATILAKRKKLEDEIAVLDGEIKKLKSPDDEEKIKEKTMTMNEKKAELDGMAAQPEEQQAARNETLIANFDALHAAITTVPTGTTFSPLAAAAMQEFYKEGDITYLLYLSAPSAGGETILQKRFWRSGQISYAGGGVVTCVLADVHGAVAYAASEVIYSIVPHKLGEKGDF